MRVYFSDVKGNQLVLTSALCKGDELGSLAWEARVIFATLAIAAIAGVILFWHSGHDIGRRAECNFYKLYIDSCAFL